MKWVKGQLATLLTLTTLLIGVGIAFGHLEASQVELSRQEQELRQEIRAKVDRATVLRELDQVHRQLAAIDARLDGVIIRQAIIADPE